ncbi:peptidoglycan-binding protein [Streptomyces sp. NPDC016459]|uniref:peptidoglycan-binding protein n=1 Tax=Streptomyces sp. NPDC016459 TaxID=3157190 RepID=UPI0033FECFA7
MPKTDAATPAVQGPGRTSTSTALPAAPHPLQSDAPVTGSPADAGPTPSVAPSPHDNPAQGHSSTPSRTQEPAEPSSRTEPRTLSRGDTGPDVTRLQQLLYGQGFTYVTVNGTYDEATRRGVVQLQRDRGLTGDPKGVYGPASRASLEGT